MVLSVPPSLKQLCTGLCLALILVFVCSSTTNTIDRIQHASTAMEHGHSLLSLATMAMDEDHHGSSYDPHRSPLDHDGAEQEGDADGRPQQHAGHHHHGDGNSGLPALAASTAAMPRADLDLASAAPEPLLLGLPPHGPERPPKALLRTA